ncbi:MAG: response regulator transcription factor [Candidatus Obscuribacterales bacterium]|nr:response regulator transcription factor [Candidatus Obscuribacterales bacterium]
MAKILLVEDDRHLASDVVDWLQFEKHIVDHVDDGNEADQRLKFYQYELLILDWELPAVSGVEICRRYRAAGGNAPVLILTGKAEIKDKEQGLDSGADDYLTKPFHLKELSARIRALLRRPAAMTGTVLKVRNLSLDTNTKVLSKDGKEIQLSPKEYALLDFLMRHPDEVFSQEDLLERVWSSESDASIFSVYTAVKTLRKKISDPDEKSVLATVHGLGYRLESK